jgi:hypothetical protein
VPWHSSRHGPHPWNALPWHSRSRCWWLAVLRVGRTLAAHARCSGRSGPAGVGLAGLSTTWAACRDFSLRETECERKQREMLIVDITISSPGGLERGWNVRLAPHIPRYYTSHGAKRTCHYQFVASIFPFLSLFLLLPCFHLKSSLESARGAYRGPRGDRCELGFS